MSADFENRSVRETEMLRPRLRDGLRFSIQEQSGRRVCVIEDSIASRFHRVGLEEYGFFRELDGTRTMASILAKLARDGVGESFTEAEALHMVRWLKDNHLLAVESARSGSDREDTAHAVRAAATWLNPLVLKLPLARPDRFFTAVEPWLRPALGGFGFLVWLAVVLTGAAHVAMDLPRFSRGFEGIFARDNWLWLFLVWAVLKAMHEFSHGVFCKHFGAAVREIGAIFIVFVPMGYVDATASLGLPSKWRRIMVAAAGLYMEFFLAAIAAIVWARTDAGTLNTIAHNAVVTGTALTLFFNANPLMRFDGYYILSDLLEIPNLATRGRGWLTRAAGWLLTNARGLKPKRLATREEWIVAIYGVASWCWGMLMLAGLLVGASVALRGGGLLLAVIAAAGWIAVPLWRFGESLAGGGGKWGTLALRGGILAAIVAGALVVPFHRSVSSPGVVELADTRVLRAECPGFVEKIHVADGDAVSEGQLLVELRNDEAASDLARSRIELKQQELRARVAYTRGEIAASQAEQAKAESLRTAVANHESFVATLQIRAPFAGRVTNRQLAQMPGAFLKAGDEVLQLGRADGSEVKIAVSEEQEPHFRAAVEQPMKVRIAGRSGVFPAVLARVEARGSRALVHPALTALAGGPLDLRRTDAEAHDDASRGDQYELARPHFTAVARLDAADSFGIGEMARVKFQSTRRVTLWSELQRAADRWLERYAQRG